MIFATWCLVLWCLSAGSIQTSLAQKVISVTALEEGETAPVSLSSTADNGGTNEAAPNETVESETEAVASLSAVTADEPALDSGTDSEAEIKIPSVASVTNKTKKPRPKTTTASTPESKPRSEVSKLQRIQQLLFELPDDGQTDSPSEEPTDSESVPTASATEASWSRRLKQRDSVQKQRKAKKPRRRNGAHHKAAAAEFTDRSVVSAAAAAAASAGSASAAASAAASAGSAAASASASSSSSGGSDAAVEVGSPEPEQPTEERKPNRIVVLPSFHKSGVLKGWSSWSDFNKHFSQIFKPGFPFGFLDMGNKGAQPQDQSDGSGSGQSAQSGSGGSEAPPPEAPPPSAEVGGQSLPSFLSPASFPGCGIIPGTRSAVSAVSARIIGGREAKAQAWPFVVAMVVGVGQIMCGGTLIRPDLVATAGHCIDNPAFAYAKILANIHNINAPESTSESIPILRPAILHKDYIPGLVPPVGDIALLRLKRPVSRKLTACIPAQGQAPPSGPNKCFIMGWGGMTPDLQLPEKLRQAAVPIVSQGKCSNAFPGKVTREMICAGTATKDACQGDSGGPLVCYQGGRWVLHGITSWGAKCGVPLPGVWSRVSAFTGWIEQQLRIIGPYRGTY